MAEGQDTARIEYREIGWLEGYRFGSDGSAWSCRKRGGFGPERVGLGDEWRKLNPSPDPDGYLSVRLSCNGSKKLFRLHRLICEAFHGPCPENMECCHDPDFSPWNNRPDNLRWGTSADNKADMEKHGRRAKGEKNGRAKIQPGDLPVIRQMIANGEGRNAIAARFNVTRKVIYNIENRLAWVDG